MKKIFLSLMILGLSAQCAFAQCGLHREVAPEVKPHQKSSVTVPTDTKNLESLTKISKKDAKKSAIKNYEGKVKLVELKQLDDKLVYLVEVKGKEGQKELFLDPTTGDFLGFGLTK